MRTRCTATISTRRYESKRAGTVQESLTPCREAGVMLSALDTATAYPTARYETHRPCADGGAAAADVQLRTSRATSAALVCCRTNGADLLGGPAAHADVVGTRRALEYCERGAPHQLGGGRSRGGVFERDVPDPQPRTGGAECQLDAVE